MLFINLLYLSFLKHAHWSDMFTGRLKAEIPKALASRLVLILVFVSNFGGRGGIHIKEYELRRK